MPSLCPCIDQSLQQILTGSFPSATKAKRVGLVHQVVAPVGPGVIPSTENTMAYLESVAITCARDLAEGKLKPFKAKRSLMQRLLWKLLEFSAFRRMFFDQARKKVINHTRGLFPAPLNIVDLIETSVAKGSKVGYELEAKMFGELAMTEESKALMVPKLPVKRLGVLVAGPMGAGIAQVSIQRDIPVVMKDVSSSSLAGGEEHIQSNLAGLVKRKQLTQVEANKTFSLLDNTLDVNSLNTVDMVIEAVFEDIALKHRVIKEVEAVLPSRAIFATNTSALPLHRIAEASKRPDKFIGINYFSPVDKMELLEITVTDKTSSDTLASATNMGLRQGKVVIVVEDDPGFYTTRLLGPMLSESILLLQEGIPATELDNACKAFGWPVGLATPADEVGVDVALHVASCLSTAFPMREVGGDINLLKDMAIAGMLGRKSGKGMYVYTDKKAKNRWGNSEASTILEKYRVVPKAQNTLENIQYRLFTRFVKEAVLCLQEGILTKGPIEGDVGVVFGLGFPPNLGGPFRYLDLYGASGLVSRVEEFRKIYGDQFTPCQLLLDHVNDNGKKFHKR
ncbi:hypothetical protein P879_09045 [Paragonimus westermani]|uniref:Enoyl-CoA hydratase n=1 Tax=Paragonimus westermani TaxID=34504 RepID=A0A8T0DED9_9TREM|nr:hypothetical protein P879_09045 [Paragonimus westermani]